MYMALRIAFVGLPLWALSINIARADEVSPNDALARLTEGNARFVDGRLTFPNSDEARRTELLKGQHPFAAVLSCSDSRVPVELIFDQGFGDIFTIRVAGNVADADEIGTIEYGAEHLGAPLLVVMGHSACGAVTAVVSGAKVGGELPGLIDNIKPAVKDARQRSPKVTGNPLVAEAIKANVFRSMGDLFRNSEIVRDRVREDQLKIVGALYDLSTGKVEWLGPHPEQKALLKSTGDARSAHAAPDGHGKPSAKPLMDKPAAQVKPAASGASTDVQPAAHGGEPRRHGPAVETESDTTDDHGKPAKADGHGEPVKAAGHGKPGHDDKPARASEDQAAPMAKSPAAKGHAEPSGGPTPREAFALLKEGNLRFSTGAPQRPRVDPARRSETASGQKPFASVLCCSDSRVPPEFVFDQGIGDLFVVRVAGNVADGDEIGSAEYAVEHLGTPVLLVLGHGSCGAVTAVVKNASVHGSIPKLVDNIAPAVQQVKWTSSNLSEGDLIRAATRSNVWRSVEDLLRRSPEIRARVEAGKLMLVGGVYDLETGRVEWLGTHPEEKVILSDAQAPADGHAAVAAEPEAGHAADSGAAAVSTPH